MKTSLITALIILIGWCSACRTVYSPNVVNNPLLQEKNELKASVGPNDLQAAYAITENIGLMVNGYLNHYTSDDKDFHNKGKAIEFGVGYFNKTQTGLLYEVYAGAGRFNVKMDESNKTKNFQSDATRFFLQPGIGWTHRYFEVGLASRLSMIDYNNPAITGYSPQEQRDYHFESLTLKPHVFLEPALTVRGGYKWVKLQAQYGRAFKLSKNELNFEDNIGSVGLVFNLAQWYK